jgi:hypothetical protein
MFGLPETGTLRPGAHADFVAIRSTDDDVSALCQSRRADLALVVRGGMPQIGDPDGMAKFAHLSMVGAILDGVPKAIHRDLARRLVRCSLREPGLELDESQIRARHAAPLQWLFSRGVG